MGRVAAVIPTFNAERFLRGHLESLLYSQSRRPDVVYVVDNASVDNTRGVVEANFPDVKLFCLDRNVGFGSACNVGIGAALADGAEWVFVLNQDTMLEEDACEEALFAIQEDGDFGLVGLFQLRYDGSGIDPVFRRFLPDLWFDDFYKRQQGTMYEVDFVPAAAILIKRRALEQVGGFDPLYFMYKEDRDLCRRLQLAGWKIGLAARSVVRHHCGQVNATRGWSWECNWAYSEAVYHLKWSLAPWPFPVLSLAKQLFKPRRVRDAAVLWTAVMRCLLRLRTIARHRTGRPAHFLAMSRELHRE